MKESDELALEKARRILRLNKKGKTKLDERTIMENHFKQYHDLIFSEKLLSDNIKEKKEMLYTITGIVIDDMPKGTSKGSSLDERIDDIRELEYRLEQVKAEIEALKTKHLNEIVKSSSTIQKEHILIARYIHKASIKKTAEFIGYSERQTKRLLKQAEREFIEKLSPNVP